MKTPVQSDGTELTDVHAVVKDKYAQAALRASKSGKFVSAFVRATKPATAQQAGCCTGDDGLPCCV